jgi:hypothetical protein
MEAARMALKVPDGVKLKSKAILRYYMIYYI